MEGIFRFLLLSDITPIKIGIAFVEEGDHRDRIDFRAKRKLLFQDLSLLHCLVDKRTKWHGKRRVSHTSPPWQVCSGKVLVQDRSFMRYTRYRVGILAG